MKKLRIIPIVMIALIVCLALSACTRNAKNGDISIRTNNDFSLGVNFTITPRANINNLQLTITFTDKDSNVITTKTKVVGNVRKDTEYKITFAVSEFSLSEMAAIKKYTVQVSGGTV